MSGVTIAPGFAPDEGARAARLFWQAFSAKLGRVLAPEDKALRLIESVLDPEYALTARDDSGALLGLAGFKTAEGGLTGGGLRDMAAVYGWFGGTWRGLVLSLLERKVQPGVFQMDGILVDAAARGRGVGTALLEAVIAEARARDLAEVQLDVIDVNPRARALYERVGFRAIGEEELGPFRHVFGFARATKMSLAL
ncbi:Ribosomal protein S18 acetylase RimI [Cribrihabitans marinus]|uniref:Ribosomal protein S18 acetylase RimI n=1 Tax=Cribrihabitans marinus TaxID=1227549 RepID=A0A1H7CDB5_9RHOB|nr:GNAT family N-acetyltransferase [Cribrihabitans marinus]GGH35210.1 molybdopterin-guanine dinucleotide biosynthesis protein MobC [Cribrihabitans marinus]SEJ87803.1 Ribosomal protein S18 acetylase RimI [Cribrihabitans marinus]